MKTCNILLIGLTGSGKSTIANVLTKTDNFTESSGVLSQTQEHQIEDFVDTNSGITYRIIDVPGVGDTNLTDSVILERIKKAVLDENCGNKLNQIFYVYGDSPRDSTDKSRIERKFIETFELFNQMNPNISDFFSIIHSNFPNFENDEDCKVRVEELKRQIPHLNLINKENFICVDNPSVEKARNNVEKIENERKRERSREKIMGFLATINDETFSLTNLNVKTNYELKRERARDAQEWLNDQFPTIDDRKNAQRLSANINDWELKGSLRFENFNNLESIIIENQFISSIDLSGAPKLKKIDFSGLELSNIQNLLDSIQNKEQITTLALAHNVFENSDLEVFGKFPNLKRLDINAEKGLGEGKDDEGTDYQRREIAMEVWKDRRQHGLFNHFFGNLEPLKNCKNLRILNICGTNVFGGWEYLTPDCDTGFKFFNNLEAVDSKGIRKNYERNSITSFIKEIFSSEAGKNWLEKIKELADQARSKQKSPSVIYSNREYKRFTKAASPIVGNRGVAGVLDIFFQESYQDHYDWIFFSEENTSLQKEKRIEILYNFRQLLVGETIWISKSFLDSCIRGEKSDFTEEDLIPQYKLKESQENGLRKLLKEPNPLAKNLEDIYKGNIGQREQEDVTRRTARIAEINAYWGTDERINGRTKADVLGKDWENKFASQQGTTNIDALKRSLIDSINAAKAISEDNLHNHAIDAVEKYWNDHQSLVGGQSKAAVLQADDATWQAGIKSKSGVAISVERERLIGLIKTQCDSQPEFPPSPTNKFQLPTVIFDNKQFCSICQQETLLTIDQTCSLCSLRQLVENFKASINKDNCSTVKNDWAKEENAWQQAITNCRTGNALVQIYGQQLTNYKAEIEQFFLKIENQQPDNRNKWLQTGGIILLVMALVGGGYYLVRKLVLRKKAKENIKVRSIG